MNGKSIDKSIDQHLMNAVSDHDVDLVGQLLLHGANPNYVDLTSYEESQRWYQPNTPLKLVVFRISDVLLTALDQRHFYQIAQLLLDRGADPEACIKLAKFRYGDKCMNGDEVDMIQETSEKTQNEADSEDYFQATLSLVAKAARKKNEFVLTENSIIPTLAATTQVDLKNIMVTGAKDIGAPRTSMNPTDVDEKDSMVTSASNYANEDGQR